MTKRRASAMGDAGAVFVIVALSLVGLLVLVAIVVDIGTAQQQKTTLRGVADAAALAGAQELSYGSAGQTSASVAASYVRRNLTPSSDDPLCTLVDSTCSFRLAGRWTTTITTPVEGDAELVKVTICEDVATTFARVIGVGSINVCGTATARGHRASGSAGTGLMIALNRTFPACNQVGLHFASSSNIDISAIVQVNECGPNALMTSGSQVITTAGVTVNGGVRYSSGAVFNPPNSLADNTGTVVADPLAAVPEPDTGLTTKPCGRPDVASDPNLPAGSGVCTYGATETFSGDHTFWPGIYGARFTIFGSGTYTFNPGVYIFEDSLTFHGNGYTVNGDGVLFFVKGPNNHTAFEGTGTIDVNPAATGPYQGLVFFSSRSNCTGLITFSSGSIWTTTGTLYGQCASVHMTSGPTVNAGNLIMGSFLVVGTTNLNLSDSGAGGTVPLTRQVQLIE